MYTETVDNYPLLGSHLCVIHFKQDISNLLLNNALNNSQIKFNWGLNVPLWSRIGLYLIVHTMKWLAVSL